MTDNKDPCSACGSNSVTRRLTQRVYGGAHAEYRECDECGTLQVDSPNWLDEAHRSPPAGSDIGAAQRALETRSFVRNPSRWKMVPSACCVLDYGAGSGILVRLLRDSGFDAWAYEPYAVPTFATEYVEEGDRTGGERYSLVTAIEVIEHCVDPLSILKSLQAALEPTGMILLSSAQHFRSIHGERW